LFDFLELKMIKLDSLELELKTL